MSACPVRTIRRSRCDCSVPTRSRRAEDENRRDPHLQPVRISSLNTRASARNHRRAVNRGGSWRCQRGICKDNINATDQVFERYEPHPRELAAVRPVAIVRHNEIMIRRHTVCTRVAHTKFLYGRKLGFNLLKARSYGSKRAFAGLRWRHAARGAGQEANSQLLFEFANSVAERGLRNAQLCRGLREAALPSHRDKRQQLVQASTLHLWPLLITPCRFYRLVATDAPSTSWPSDWRGESASHMERGNLTHALRRVVTMPQPLDAARRPASSGGRCRPSAAPRVRSANGPQDSGPSR